MTRLPIIVNRLILANLVVGLLTSAGTTSGAQAKGTAPSGHSFSGYSHHYHDRFHGKRTASGQAHDKFKLSAAHRTLPFGTHLLVTNTRNGKSCVVVVNDRGPFGSQSLVLDVSKAAAHKLGFPGGGKIPVLCKVIDAKTGAVALKDSQKDCEEIVAKIAATDSKKNLTEATVKQDAVQASEKIAKLSVPQVKPATETKPQEKIQIAAKPKESIVTTEKSSHSTHAKSAASETHEVPVHGTFLLVINDALEPEHSLKTAEFNPAQSHYHGQGSSAYAPTVFMRVDEAAGGKHSNKNHVSTPAIAENQVLM